MGHPAILHLVGSLRKTRTGRVTRQSCNISAMNTFQQRRDEVITTLIAGDEQPAKAYIESIGDSDERDVARTQLAQFLTNRNLAGNRALNDVFQIIGEIENLTEKLDALLAISRILD